MNWYNKIRIAMPLSPDAYNMHEDTHMMGSDHPYVAHPFGFGMMKNPNQLTPEQEREKYKGVHATITSPEMAAAYANNVGSIQDPPVVIEFETDQIENIDADGMSFIGDADEIFKNAIEDSESLNQLREWIEDNPDQRPPDELIDEAFEDLDFYSSEFTDDEPTRDYNEYVFQSNRSRQPKIIQNYFFSMFPNNPAEAFYERLAKPYFSGEGQPDFGYASHAVNQTRFFGEIGSDSVTGVFFVEPYDEESWGEYDESKGQYNEQGKMRVTSPEFTPSIDRVWTRPVNHQQRFDWYQTPKYYHGTSISRARQSLPELEQAFQAVEAAHQKRVQSVQEQMAVRDNAEYAINNPTENEGKVASRIMNWYRKIQAATLPINSLKKAIEGTFRNMVPGITRINHLPERASGGRVGQISYFSFYAPEGYPVFYMIELHAAMDRNAQSFETDSPSSGVEFTLKIDINKDWSYAMFEKRPEWSNRIDKLRQIMANMIGDEGDINNIYKQRVDSVYAAASEVNRVISLIDNLLDGDGGGGEDNEETDPWFPGDPAADWEFEQEQDMLSFVPSVNKGQKSI